MCAFVIDKQTLNDLNIFSKHKGDSSVLAIYDRAQTYGGRQMLEFMFANVLCDVNKIDRRSSIIKYLQKNPLSLCLKSEVMDFIEHYMSIVEIPTRPSKIDALRRSWWSKIRTDNQYYIIKRGILYIIEITNDLYQYALDSEMEQYANEIKDILQDTHLSLVFKHKGKSKLSAFNTNLFDHIFRYISRDHTRRLLDIIYELDALNSVAKVALESRMAFAEVIPSADINEIEITDLYNPLISSAVRNSIRIDNQHNIFFITGANMAGKSTFMKAFGITVYLAHMGFPVPASFMRFSIQEGLLSTINISDSLSLGYSHFYAEVRRIKFVAQAVSKHNRIMVLFDELFRGTNVKDAHDASIAIISAFANANRGLFIISTHILEAAQDLKSNVHSIKFHHFPTSIVNEFPTYTYTMKEGISSDRLGMTIIANEKILEIIENSHTID